MSPPASIERAIQAPAALNRARAVRADGKTVITL
jgi:hypothetical protein